MLTVADAKRIGRIHSASERAGLATRQAIVRAVSKVASKGAMVPVAAVVAVVAFGLGCLLRDGRTR